MIRSQNMFDVVASGETVDNRNNAISSWLILTIIIVSMSFFEQKKHIHTYTQWFMHDHTHPYTHTSSVLRLAFSLHTPTLLGMSSAILRSNIYRLYIFCHCRRKKSWLAYNSKITTQRSSKFYSNFGTIITYYYFGMLILSTI